MNTKTVIAVLLGLAVLFVGVRWFLNREPAFTPSANVIEVTTANFEKEVIDATGPVIIDFNAEWCGPCKTFKPVFHKLADQYAGKVKFISIDVDKNPEVAALFRVQQIPAIVFLKQADNKIHGGGALGALNEEQLKKLLDYCLQPDAQLVPLFEKKAPEPKTDPAK